MQDLAENLHVGWEEEADIGPTKSQRLEKTSNHDMCSMRFDLHWQSELATHMDCQVMPKLNLWRDIFPPEMESALLDKPVGHVEEHRFPAGRLIEDYRRSDCLEVLPKAFNRRHRKGNFIEPRAGRFYPKGFIAGVKDIYPENLTPFRMARVGDKLTVDLNHPLAQHEMTMQAKILDIWQAGEEHGGSCHHIPDLVTLNGPGMQARWRGEPTDFWSDIPFMRFAPEADEAFYAKARMVDHLDALASKQIETLYDHLIPRGGEVLDLMSSWKSHLPAQIEPSGVVGLGMNREELDANPILTERLVHDLNLKPQLPFEDGRFDAVVCTVSVEYLIKPVEVFAEINRVLKPGGRFIVSFSNRWFPPKVVRVWEGVHEFERMGIVLEYFHLAGGYTNLATWSLRGLPRPADDKYANQMAQSDPIYAVWGDKV